MLRTLCLPRAPSWSGKVLKTCAKLISQVTVFALPFATAPPFCLYLSVIAVLSKSHVLLLIRRHFTLPLPHTLHTFCASCFLFHEGGHANLARRETFTHVESANKKIDFETIWSDIAWRFYSHCGPFGILSEYFLVFSESISIRRAFFWFARYGKLFSFDMPQVCIVSFDTFLLFFMQSVNFFFLMFSAWKGKRLKLQTHVNELANSFSFFGNSLPYFVCCFLLNN